MIAFLEKNAWAILILLGSIAISAGTFWVDYKIENAKHEKAGTAEAVATKSEIRTVRREIRQIENLLDQSPSELYDPSRRANLRELKDELRELEAEAR